ncbi:MAG: 16S rRNA (cytosine(1402)-N(4))-methyltransferase RsmH [Rhodothermales bacterium]|nr:16S rRNA (cytosine(1402)-N(4))-methyltransferase RsmH [Rhodothermales bacterium]
MAPGHDSAETGGDPLRYASVYHAPVLWNAVTEGLITDPAGLYVDATLGGGGHSAALLDALGPEGRVIGIDQDEEALAEARRRLTAAAARGRFRAVQGNFGNLERLLADLGIEAVDGLLLDLGVSSHQLDEGARGFSFQAEAPLDMRMDRRTGLTADEIVNRWSDRELARVLREYGEEPRAWKITRAILAARPIATTTALADVIRRVVPTREEVKTLSRVFQGLRIAVNGELERLEQALAAATRVLRPGGRVAVISYHSLEDRRVKRFLRYGNLRGEPVRDFYGNLITPWNELTRKPLGATEAEVAANPRARSARLRIAERLEDALEDEG